MKALLKYLPLTLLAAVFACTKPVDPVEEKPVEQEDTFEATINFSTSNSITLDADEGAKGSIVFSCDHEWTLEIPEEAQE